MDALNGKEVIVVNKGAWTAEEDRSLAEVVAVHGPRRWKAVAVKAGLNRCGKSCRLRWMNYLRPNIKRGDISDQEEDLILRLHKLLGDRWSLIAGRLPGRTDNEIKNYWNSHLSKKVLIMKADDDDDRRDLGDALSRGLIKRKMVCEDEYNYKKQKKKKEDRAEEDNNATIHEHSTTTAMAKNGDIIGEDMGNCSSFNVDDLFDFSSEDPLNLDWITAFFQPPPST